MRHKYLFITLIINIMNNNEIKYDHIDISNYTLNDIICDEINYIPINKTFVSNEIKINSIDLMENSFHSIELEFINNDLYEYFQEIQSYIIYNLHEYVSDKIPSTTYNSIKNKFKNIIKLPKTINLKPYLQLDTNLDKLELYDKNGKMINDEKYKYINCIANVEFDIRKVLFKKSFFELDININKIYIKSYYTNDSKNLFTLTENIE